MFFCLVDREVVLHSRWLPLPPPFCRVVDWDPVVDWEIVCRADGCRSLLPRSCLKRCVLSRLLDCDVALFSCCLLACITVITIASLCNLMLLQSGMVKKCTHLWYTHWPDHGNSPCQQAQTDIPSPMSLMLVSVC